MKITATEDDHGDDSDYKYMYKYKYRALVLDDDAELPSMYGDQDTPRTPHR